MAKFNFLSGTNNWLSTGSNAKDMAISGLAGLGNAFNNKPGQFYVQANWKGRGLADTGIGYMRNPNYRDYFSAAQSLAGQLGNQSPNNAGLWQNIIGQSPEEYMKKMRGLNTFAPSEDIASLWSNGTNTSNIIGPTYQQAAQPFNNINRSLPTTVSYNKPSWMGE